MNTVRLGVLGGSVLSGVLGFAVLRVSAGRTKIGEQPGAGDPAQA